MLKLNGNLLPQMLELNCIIFTHSFSLVTPLPQLVLLVSSAKAIEAASSLLKSQMVEPSPSFSRMARLTDTIGVRPILVDLVQQSKAISISSALVRNAMKFQMQSSLVVDLPLQI
jgi:hypothetical protein